MVVILLEDLWEIKSPMLKSNSFFKSTPNDSFVVCREEVASLVTCCKKNNLTLDTDKTNEMSVDMKNERTHLHLIVRGGEGEPWWRRRAAPNYQGNYHSTRDLWGIIYSCILESICVWSLAPAESGKDCWDIVRHSVHSARPLFFIMKASPSPDMDCPQSFPLDCERQ